MSGAGFILAINLFVAGLLSAAFMMIAVYDRSRVAAGEEFDVLYMVEQAGITRPQALELIKRYGNDRETLMRHAKNLER